MYKPEDLRVMVKPTNLILPDFVEKVNSYKPDLLLFSVVEDTFKDTKLLLKTVEHLNIPHIVGVGQVSLLFRWV